MRILITGLSTRAIAQSALASGYDFVTLDYFGDYDQKGWCENYSLKRDFNLSYGPAKLCEASRRLRYDAVVYTASLENHPRSVVQLDAGAAKVTTSGPEMRRSVLGLLGNGPEVLSKVRNWSAFFAFLRNADVPVPQTLLAGQLPAPGSGRRWLRKPVESGGGHDITFWQEDRPPGPGYMLQEHLPGRSCSAAFLANGRDAVVLGLTEQLIGRREFGGQGFVYSGNIFPLPPGEDAGEDVPAKVCAVVKALTREFGLVGLNGLDFVLHGGRVYPLELNPRYSASMELIEMASGQVLFDCHVTAILQGQLPPQRALSGGGQAGTGPGRGYYGKAIMYAERDCRAPDTRTWPERAIRDVPFPGDEIALGSPVCTIVAHAATASGCYNRLVDQAQELKRELYG